MPTPTKRTIPPLAALLLMLVTTACAGAFALEESPLDPSLDETPPLETAFPFTLPSASDGSVSLESYAGKRNVVLVFYRGFW